MHVEGRVVPAFPFLGTGQRQSDPADVLGIGSGALVLWACGQVPSVESPWNPETWDLMTAPAAVLVATTYVTVTRLLVWYVHTPRTDLPTVVRTALVRQGVLGVALLAIAPLICVVTVARPLLLPLFAVPLPTPPAQANW